MTIDNETTIDTAAEAPTAPATPTKGKAPAKAKPSKPARAKRAAKAAPAKSTKTKAKPAAKAKPATKAKPKGPTRKDQIIEMLRQPGGTTIEAIVARFGVKPHSARASISVYGREIGGVAYDKESKAYTPTA